MRPLPDDARVRPAVLVEPQGLDPGERLVVPGAVDCPDLFELPVDGDPKNTRWVFWTGISNYFVGSFDGRTFTPEGPVRTAEQGANGYAAQT